MLNAIAIDDEPHALELIEYYCNQMDTIQLQKTFTVAEDATKYMKKYPVDLVFLDVQMPGILGTEFRKKIPKDILVVFTTAYSNYAVEGYELDVVDFLLKPYSIDRFKQSCDKANTVYQQLNQKPTEEKPFLYLRADYSLIKVPLDDLLYVEGLEDYCKFHFDNDPPMVFRITMKSLMDKLPNNLFIRVHRSYIVHIDKVEKARGNTIYLPNKEIPIGRLYKAELLEYYKKDIS
jgi:two-component system, LytTR family, response regulator